MRFVAPRLILLCSIVTVTACSADSIADAGPDTPVVSVTLTVTPTTVAVGQTAQGSVRLTSAYGAILTGRTISWYSSDSLVASVTQAGLITGRRVGATSIFATVEGRQDVRSFSVTGS